MRVFIWSTHSVVGAFRGGSRTAATSKMVRFVIIVNGWKPLTIITKRSILDVAAVLDPPLALLLEVVITIDEQIVTLTVVFSLLKLIFPDDSFFGKKMPDVIMTDNCSELREASSEVFPTSNLLLCSFHILQQLWR